MASTNKGKEQLIAFPLVLPMGWKNSPAIFSTATETITDLANARLQGGLTPPSYLLDDAAEAIPTVLPLDSTPVPVSILRPAKQGLPRSKRNRRTTLPQVQRIRWKRCFTSVLRPSTKTGTPSQPLRDPCLPKRTKPVSYIDVFVDNFIGLAQQTGNSREVRQTLLHAIDDVLHPMDAHDNPHRREPVSLKKLRQGDCS